jgi:hypothetical protein
MADELPYDELIDHAFEWIWRAEAAADRNEWQKATNCYRKGCHALNAAALQLRTLLKEKCEKPTS